MTHTHPHATRALQLRSRRLSTLATSRATAPRHRPPLQSAPVRTPDETRRGGPYTTRAIPARSHLNQSCKIAFMPVASDRLWKPCESPQEVESSRNSGFSSIAALVLYLVALALVSLHLYRTPSYDMDSIQYMGNALLMHNTDVVQIHQQVYSELRHAVPGNIVDQLVGNEIGAPADQNLSRKMRASDPYRFAEFLPLFAIRPLYNQVLYVVSKTGIGLVGGGILISVASFFFLGVLLFLWMRPYTTPLLSLSAGLLCMITPPLTSLGRDMTSDALASLVAFASLYLIFEKRLLMPGIALLLSSIYFRTDFVVLAAPVILICWLQRRLRLWQAAILGGLAVSSVLFINHFAGDYGIQMLYYRNFVGTPAAPAEMIVRFSFHDYLSAFRSGITKVMQSFFLPFLVLGAISLRSRQCLPLLLATLAYVILHFLVLPNWQERWVGVFYLTTVICAVQIHKGQQASTGTVSSTPV